MTDHPAAPNSPVLPVGLRKTLDDLVGEWGAARRARLVVKRQMDQHWCEFRERGDGLTGDDGRAPCYQLWADVLTVNEEVCDSCKKREPLFQQMKALRRVEKAVFRRVTRRLDREVTTHD